MRTDFSEISQYKEVFTGVLYGDVKVINFVVVETSLKLSDCLVSQWFCKISGKDLDWKAIKQK